MTSYKIQKLNNNEYKEVSKELSLDVNEYCKDPKTLKFNVTGEENPYCTEFYTFYQTMIEQIGQGFIESMEYEDGLIMVTMRDGTVIKNYLYDFHWDEFANRMKADAFNELKTMIMKIVSFYNDNPYREMLNEAKYLRMIYDIMDADRPQAIANKEDVMKVLATYNKYKAGILELMLSRVVFFDDQGRILAYPPLLRKKKLKAIKFDVLRQMEFTMLLFAGINQKSQEYKEYLDNTYIPRRHVFYQCFDDEGNLLGVVDATATQKGTILSMGKEFAKEQLGNLRSKIAGGMQKVGEKLQGQGRSR